MKSLLGFRKALIVMAAFGALIAGAPEQAVMTLSLSYLGVNTLGKVVGK